MAEGIKNDLKISKAELLDIYRFFGKDNTKVIIPPGADPRNFPLELKTLRKIVADLLESERVKNLREDEDVPWGSYEQLEAAFKLQSYRKVNEDYKDVVLTREQLQKEINEYYSRKGLINLSLEDEKRLNNDVARLSAILATMPTEGNFVVALPPQAQESQQVLRQVVEVARGYKPIDTLRELNFDIKRAQLITAQRKQQEAIEAQRKAAAEAKENAARKEQGQLIQKAMEEEDKMRAAQQAGLLQGLTPEEIAQKEAERKAAAGAQTPAANAQPTTSQTPSQQPVPTVTTTGQQATTPQISNVNINQPQAGNVSGQVTLSGITAASGAPTFSLSGNFPNTIKINPTTGQISSTQQLAPGNYNITVNATLPNGQSTQQVVSINVPATPGQAPIQAVGAQPGTAQPSTTTPPVATGIKEVFLQSKSNAEKEYRDKYNKAISTREKRLVNAYSRWGTLGVAVEYAKLGGEAKIPTRGPAYFKNFKGDLKKYIGVQAKSTVVRGARWVDNKIVKPNITIPIRRSALRILNSSQTYVSAVYRIKALKAFAKKKKQKDGLGGLAGSLIQAFVKQTVEKAFDTVKAGVKVAKKGVTAARNLPGVKQVTDSVLNSNTSSFVKAKWDVFAQSAIGQKIAGSAKAITPEFVTNGLSRVGNSMVRVYKVGADIVVPSTRSMWTLAKGGMETVKFAGNYIKAIPYGALTGLGTVLIAGPSLPAIVAGAGIGLAVKGTSNFLASEKLIAQIPYSPDKTPLLFKPFVWGVSKLTGVMRNVQIAHGWGQFFNKGALNFNAAQSEQGIRALQTGRKNIYTGASRMLRITNSGLTFGSIGAAIGFAFGNPVAGAAIGAAAGVGLRAIFDSRRGARFADAVLYNNSRLPGWIKAIAHLPTTMFANQVLGNFWLTDQIKTLKNEYNWNVAKFIGQEYGGVTNIFRGDPMGALMSSSNWLGAYGYYSSTSVLFRNIFTDLLPKLAGTKSIFANVASKAVAGASASMPIKIITPANIVGTIVGTAVGIMLSSLFGLPIGPGAILGGAIGSIAGTIGGTILVAPGVIASGGIGGGLGFAIVSGVTAATTALGTFIGSLFDRSLARITNVGLSVFNAFQSLKSLLHLLRSGFDMDRMIPLTFAIITLSSMMQKGGTLLGANECLPDNTNCTGTAPNSSAGVNELYLAHYNTTLVAKDANLITQNNVRSIIQALADSDYQKLQRLTAERKLYIALGEDASFYDEKFIILGLAESDIYDLNKLSLELKSRITILEENFARYNTYSVSN